MLRVQPVRGHFLSWSGMMRFRNRGARATWAGSVGLALVACGSSLPTGGAGPGPCGGKEDGSDRRARTWGEDSSGREVCPADEAGPDVHQGRGDDPPDEVPELPSPPPGRAVRPRDLRAGPEAISRHRRGDRGAVDASVEADRRGRAASSSTTSRSPTPRSPSSPPGPRRVPRAATPRTCRRRPSSPRAGSSGRPT